MLAEAGLGWSLLPHTMVEPPLIALDVKELELVRQLGIVIHKDRSLSNAAKEMMNLCKNKI